MFGVRHFCVSLSSFRWSDFRDFFFRLFNTVSEKSAAAVRNAYGVILQIIAVGNKGREIA